MTQNGQLMRIFLVILCTLATLGCKSENPNPELLDPIYKDLLKELSGAEKNLQDEQKRLEGFYKDLENSRVMTMNRTTAKNDIKKSKLRVAKLQQEVDYLKIRVERRRVEGRRNYKITFKNGGEWPSPKEYEKYQLYKKLKTSSLNWNERVPKFDRNNPNFKEE